MSTHWHVGGGSIIHRPEFDREHMKSAAYFARKAFDIEENHTALINRELYVPHRGYVIGAVLSSVASLEAAINAIYIDAPVPNSPTFQDGNPKVPKALAAANWQKLERRSILHKYQKALRLTQKPEFNKRGSPYQEVESLIELRHVLVHYKPEWNTAQKKHKEIEDRLKSLKSPFKPNPAAESYAPFFPRHCLGHGCAEWAVESSIEFIDDFCRKLGIRSLFSQVDPQNLRTR
jgi:hypothetical protein